MTTTIRITDPVDLVKVVPYQLGYHPERSIVLIGLRRKQIGLVQRLDLPTLPRDCAAAAELMSRHLLADGCTAAVLVIYEDIEAEGALAGETVASRLRNDRVQVVDHVVVRGERAFFPGPAGRIGRPVAGVALPPDDRVPAVADYVAHGRQPARSRDALDERLAPSDDVLRERVRLASVRLGVMRPVRGSRPRAMADWGAFLDVRDEAWFHGRLPSAAATARMCHSLRDLQVRDLISAWLCPGTLDLGVFDEDLQVLAAQHFPPRGRCAAKRGDDPSSCGAGRAGEGRSGVGADEELDSDRLVERMCWLARHAPDLQAPAVLTVLATLTWHLGEGTLTRLALDRALALEPGYRLALLLERMVDLAIRPGQALSSTG